MGRYNLLDERWISVISGENGHTKLLSLKEVFSEAADCYDLAGEMKTQDFAVLRVLLAILHTVFSRFDADGKPYEMLAIDEETDRQLDPVEEEDREDYADALLDTWLRLWRRGNFPEIVQEYLECWRDRFYLFDDVYPFYQVIEKDTGRLAEGKKNFFGKNINRTISESSNKIALFAPVNGTGGAKDRLKYDQLVRWLITYQGYAGTADKEKVRAYGGTCSKGWLYDLGGIYLRGENLFETLLLNCCLVDPEQEEPRMEIPAWERTPRENVEIYFDHAVNNRASLYTSWARIVCFDRDFQEGEPFSCFVAKLPEINHVQNFLEPMTCWTKAKSGPNKDYFTPQKHCAEESMWRHFSVIMGLRGESADDARRPGVIRWLGEIGREIRESEKNRVRICAVSMKDDENATSWAPTDEIIDSIQLDAMIAADLAEDGWLKLINGVIVRTREVINRTLVRFLRDISKIRGLDRKDDSLIKQGREDFYQRIDRSFRKWLSSLRMNSYKDKSAGAWYEILERELSGYGENLFRNASARELKGIKQDKDKNEKNSQFCCMPIAYNSFCYRVYREFHKEG